MNQYVRWLGGSSLTKGLLQTERTFSSPMVTSVGGRSYAMQPTVAYTHDDFYRNATIKQWYKNYVSMILNRFNVFTGKTYKNEPTIMLWELANEPRSLDVTGLLVNQWMDEMSSFIKTTRCIVLGRERKATTSRVCRTRPLFSRLNSGYSTEVPAFRFWKIFNWMSSM